MLAHFLFFFYHHHHPCHPHLPATSLNHLAMSPSSLLSDVGLSNITPAPSEARMQPLLPLPFLKGCGQLGLAQGRNEQVRGAKGDLGGGRPGRYIIKMGYNVCCSLFFSHHFFSQPQPTFNNINPHIAPTTHITIITTT